MRTSSLSTSIWVSEALLTALWLTAAASAMAQRAEDNAVTVAEDAFGTNMLLQNVGLYSQGDARGFSPQQAENLRIEGLYFDQQTAFTNPCMVRQTTMRIGIAAQSYSFPSPTGIADITLRTPGDLWAFSGLVSRGPFNGLTVQVEEQVPIDKDSLSVDLCAGFSKNSNVDFLRQDESTALGTTIKWRPGSDTEIVPFWTYYVGGGHDALPIVYTDGNEPLSVFAQRDSVSQTWASQGWRMTTFGVLAKSALSDDWKITAGLFHSQEDDPLSFYPFDQLLSRARSDFGVDAIPPWVGKSTSGEFRVTGVSMQGDLSHQLEFALRGRAIDREYGGDDYVDFGPVTVPNRASFAQPTLVLTTPSHDKTHQLDFGASYEERWQGIGSAAIGVLKSNYQRTAMAPATASETVRTTPWLIDLRAKLNAGSRLKYYASYTQGLEDSAQAPAAAVNRGEPPPAARTWQVDGGIRYEPNSKWRLILGAFEIHKPYLNLDGSDVYRTLGSIRSIGEESSVSYTDDGLTALAGAVRLQPRIAYAASVPGANGEVPLGPVPLTLTANLDYAPSFLGPWAASVQWTRLSSRYATIDNTQRLAPLATLGAGIRFHWKAGESSWTLRLDGFNITDARGLHVSNVGVVLPEQGRRVSLTLAVDR